MTQIENKDFPVRTPDFAATAEVLRKSRAGSIPVLNLKTSRYGLSEGEGCPLKCGYCDVQHTDTGIIFWRDWSSSRFSAFMEDWESQGGIMLHVCGNGEPAMFRLFPEIIAQLDHGIKLEFFTNTFGLQRYVKTIMQSGDRTTIKFKLDTRNTAKMGSILRPDWSEDRQLALGSQLMANIDELVELRDERLKELKSTPLLIASIVVSAKTVSDLQELIDWCVKRKIIPQINYLEPVEGSLISPPTQSEVIEINRFLKQQFGINPKQIMSDYCMAHAAPMVAGSDIVLGPFGLGCEFALSGYVGQATNIGSFRKFSDIPHLINEYRYSPLNIAVIKNELSRILNREGQYALEGTDSMLSGCGTDIQSHFLLNYVAGLFTSEEYFRTFSELLQHGIIQWDEKDIVELITDFCNNNTI